MKRTKCLKGFTLLELILVMAIFGILMAAVMSVLKPLNKLTRRVTIEEANAAAVDNIKSYVEGSLRYADCMQVCVGGLTDDDDYLIGPCKDDSNEAEAGVVKTYLADQYGLSKKLRGEEKTVEDMRIEAAVVNFVNGHFANRTNPGTDDPLTGKVRVMKIDNENGGVISEYEYDFTAGYTYTKFCDKDETVGLHGNAVELKKGDVKKKEVYDKATKTYKIVQDMGLVNSTITPMVGNGDSVINPVYYENYAFYFKPGYNQLETINDESLVSGFNSDVKESTDYYAALTRIDTDKEKDYDYLGTDLFSLSVVTFKNDTTDGAYGEDYDYQGTYTVTEGTETEEFVAFQSPFAISNTNVSLVNIKNSFSNRSNIDNYGPVRYEGIPNEASIALGYAAPLKDDTGADKAYAHDVPVKAEGGKRNYERITSDQDPKIEKLLDKHKDFDENSEEHKLSGYPVKDVIYFIYTLPDFV